MLSLAFDENFNFDIVRGLMQRAPDLDIVRVQDTILSGADDPAILQWAAGEGRVLLTHDRNTLIGFAYERVARGLLMPGVFAVPLNFPIGVAIEEILTLAMCSAEGEWEGQVNYLPLK